MSDSIKERVDKALKAFIDPVIEVSPLAGGVLEHAELDDGVLDVRIRLGFPAATFADELGDRLIDYLRDCAGLGCDVRACRVGFRSEIRSHAVQRNLKPIGAIKNIVAVASAKGGVGKSTTAVNLALALAGEGARVGLLDADIYGPSQPRMLGLRGQHPQSRDGKTLEPLQAHGIVAMSIGFLIDEDQPMVWRGPMVTQALNQIISETDWGELDYLIVDMPPGTGDTQLTMSQRVPVSGVVIVTTPQDIALLDARKGLKMFEKVEVTVLGIVENMSTHICSNCGHEEHIFGAGGGQRMAQETGVEFLGSVPLDIAIREQADSGRPTVSADPGSALARAYRDIALRSVARLAGAGKDYSRHFPNIVVEDT